MKIIIIGAGVAGPVLAMLLKHKGFEPVIYERNASVPSGGLALALSAQSFKVLNIIGLADEVLALGIQTEAMVQRSEITGKILQERTERQSGLRETTGWPMSVTMRSKYSKFLVEKTEERGIAIHWGKKLVDVKQDGDKVTAVFEDGTSDVGDLLVGCDGLHSKVRDALFGKTPAEYTGLVAIGGLTPWTDELPEPKPLLTSSVWGRGCHFFCSPTAEHGYFWASTMAEEAEMLEDWRTAGSVEISDVLTSLPSSKWSGDTGKIIASSRDVVKFGLYLRPIPPVWHKGRAVLLGDAAHPTTPFLGQGANVTAEDIYHLVRALVFNEPLTNESIEKTFIEYTAGRLPTAMRVYEQGKREIGYRLATSDEDLKARDEMKARGMNSDTAKLVAQMLQGPYIGESEI